MCNHTSSSCGEIWDNNFSSAVLFGPCSTSTCAQRAGYSTSRVFAARYEEPSPAPNILDANSSILADSTLNINVSLDNPGTVYCSSYRANQVSEKPSDIQSIVLDGNLAVSEYDAWPGSYVAKISIDDDNMIPITAYNFTCFTISEEGTYMTYAEAISQSSAHIPQLTTSCCKTVKVKTDIATFNEGSDQTNAATITVDFLPSSDVTLMFSLVKLHENGSTHSVFNDAVLPPSLSLSSTSTTSELYLAVAFKGSSMLGGSYRFDVAVGGTSDEEYVLDYTTSNSVSVISLNEEPPHLFLTDYPLQMTDVTSRRPSVL